MGRKEEKTQKKRKSEWQKYTVLKWIKEKIMCGRKNHKEKTNEEERRIIKKECGYKIWQ